MLELDLEAIRERVQRASNEELVRMISDGSEGGRGEVLALAKAELDRRESDPDLVAPESETSAAAPEDHEQEVLMGTGGWLGLLISILVFVTPWTFLVLVMDVSSISSLNRTDPTAGWLLLSFIPQAGVLAYLFFCGIALWKEMPGSILHTERALIASAVVMSVVSLMTGDIVWAVRSVFVPVIWIAYLRKSRRVLNTYPSWALHMRSKGSAASVVNVERGGEVPPGFRPHWPILSLLVVLASLFGVYIASMPDPQTTAALDEFDGVVAGMRSDFDGARFLVDNVPAERLAAVGHAITGIRDRYMEIEAVLAEEHGVQGRPNAMWLTDDYYVRPSAYPDVRSYFVGVLSYLAAVREVLSAENLRVIVAEVYAQEGLGSGSDAMDDVMRGFAIGRAPQDTLNTVMEAYATTAIEFHDELRRFAGGFYIDPVSGKLVADTAPGDNLIALEESLEVLDTEILERQERAVTLMESTEKSLQEWVSR